MHTDRPLFLAYRLCPTAIIIYGCHSSTYNLSIVVIHLHLIYPLQSYVRACLMNANAPKPQISSGRKRRRDTMEEEKSTAAVESPQPPWKRARIPFQSQQEANAAYWDSVSKLYLTQRALREFDYRDRSKASLSRPTPVSGSERSEELAALKVSSIEIKLSAMHGGPDLCDLRGVSIIQTSSTRR